MRISNALRQLALLGIFSTTTGGALAAAPVANDYLKRGAFAEGEKAFTQHLAANADDDQAWFGLGTLRLVASFEELLQALYRHGLSMPAGVADPVSLFGIPNHPAPEVISYAKAGKILKDWLAGLASVNEALSHIDSDSVKLPIEFGRIRIDIDADGEATATESFWGIVRGMDGGAPVAVEPEAGQQAAEEMPPVLIHLDKGDVHWLAGYCHLLSAGTEILLAHDNRESFGTFGRLMFPKVDSGTAIDRVPFRMGEGRNGNVEMEMIAEAIAAFHLIRWEVDEPERLANALAHLEAVVAESRLSWASILAEEDDDNEWLPNPKQTSITGLPVSAEQVAAWSGVMDEVELVLKGDKLIPHWRFPAGEGVNLRRMFTEPQRFDLVMILHGAGVVPYLEKGDVTDAATWRGLTRAFGGDFFGFAAWFN